jgi:hypothetical protein
MVLRWSHWGPPCKILADWWLALGASIPAAPEGQALPGGTDLGTCSRPSEYRTLGKACLFRSMGLSTVLDPIV